MNTYIAEKLKTNINKEIAKLENPDTPIEEIIRISLRINIQCKNYEVRHQYKIN